MKKQEIDTVFDFSHNICMKNIRKHIKSDEIDKSVNMEKQNRHIRGSDSYVEGRSYLLDGINPQELVDMYHGTGEEKFTQSGKWKNKEVITADSNIGINIDPATGMESITNKFTIHYSKTGTHIVPAERSGRT
jgi:hypothetical protein